MAQAVGGRSGWEEYDFASAFAVLSRSESPKVRRSLAFSLHETARLIGPELTAECLLPVFESLLGDPDEIKMGIICHSGDFVDALPSENGDDIRDGVVRKICGLDSSNWRVRQCVAAQLPSLGSACSIDCAKEVVVPCLLQLLADGVHDVRWTAIGTVGTVLSFLLEHGLERDLVSDLQNLAVDESFQKRQAFIHICGSAHQCVHDLFESDFLPLMTRLADDPVPNIRIALARFMGSIWYDSEIANTLKNDSDRDVREVMEASELTRLRSESSKLGSPARPEKGPRAQAEEEEEEEGNSKADGVEDDAPEDDEDEEDGDEERGDSGRRTNNSVLVARRRVADADSDEEETGDNGASS